MRIDGITKGADMSLNSTFFKVEIDGPVAHLAMNRPAKANSMSPDFWADLPRLCAALENDPTIRAVIVSGEGKHFTAGMDFAAFERILDLLAREPGRAAYALRDLIKSLQNSLSALEALRVPVIAAIDGACIGGGIDLITACDIRLATRSASFAVEEINLGLAADVGTLQRLPTLIPPGIARELALTGRRFSADEALAWGLCSAVCDSRAELMEKATEMAKSIAAKSPLAVAGTKRGSLYARDHSVADGLDQIATWNAGMLRPEELRTALKAKQSGQAALFADLLATGGI